MLPWQTTPGPAPRPPPPTKFQQSHFNPTKINLVMKLLTNLDTCKSERRCYLLVKILGQWAWTGAAPGSQVSCLRTFQEQRLPVESAHTAPHTALRATATSVIRSWFIDVETEAGGQCDTAADLPGPGSNPGLWDPIMQFGIKNYTAKEPFALSFGASALGNSLLSQRNNGGFRVKNVLTVKP